MWKTQNSSDKITKSLNNTRTAIVTSNAGTNNIFGCRTFTEQFLTLWQQDDYPNYLSIKIISDILPSQTTSLDEYPSGISVLHNIISKASSSSVLLSNILNNIKSITKEDNNPLNITSTHNLKNININASNMKSLFNKKPEMMEFIYLEMIKEGLTD